MLAKVRTATLIFNVVVDDGFQNLQRDRAVGQQKRMEVTNVELGTCTIESSQ